MKNSKMQEAAISTLNGLVPGRGTSCEAPSSEPQSRLVPFLRCENVLFVGRYCVAISMKFSQINCLKGVNCHGTEAVCLSSR